MRSRLNVALLVSAAVAGLWLAPRGLSQESPGQTVGLAAKYPGDKGTLIFAGKYDSPAATDLSLYLDLFGVQQRWNSRNTVVDRVLNRQPAMVLKSSFQGQGLDFGIGKSKAAIEVRFSGKPR